MAEQRFLTSLKRNRLVNKYFFEQKRPFETSTKVNSKVAFRAVAIVLVLGIAVILLWPTKKEEPEAHFPSPENASTSTLQKQNAGTVTGPSDSSAHYSSSGGSIPGFSRNRNSNQVISRNQQNSTGTGLVAMGSTLEVALLNAVVSGNQTTPVIAVVQGSTRSSDVPEGARALGNASFDEGSKRMQIRFHTFVYPDGEQRNITAMAMMPDGSSGLEGDYSSGEAKRQTGRFLGNFIGGMAQGLKDRSQGGMFGGPFEPGSIRNGILNGVAMSAEDQAKNYSDSMTNERPSMSLQPGTRFLLYFEHEFNP